MSWNKTRLDSRNLIGITTFGIAAIVAGCGPSPKPKAAQALACSKDQITYEDADRSGAAVIITGCGKKDILTLDNGKWGSLRERAAFEMTCGAGELEVTAIESTVFGVTGCNRKIVYKWSPYVGVVVQTASDGPATASPAQEAAPAVPAPTPVAPEPAPAAAPEPTAAAPAAAAAPASKAKAKSKK